MRNRYSIACSRIPVYGIMLYTEHQKLQVVAWAWNEYMEAIVRRQMTT